MQLCEKPMLSLQACCHPTINIVPSHEKRLIMYRNYSIVSIDRKDFLMADVVHCNHDALKQIAGQFDTLESSVKKATDQLQSQMDLLKGGGWVAPAADKFYGIMENEILASLTRLSSALNMAGNETNNISKIMQQAEENAKGSLNF